MAHQGDLLAAVPPPGIVSARWTWSVDGVRDRRFTRGTIPEGVTRRGERWTAHLATRVAGRLLVGHAGIEITNAAPDAPATPTVTPETPMAGVDDVTCTTPTPADLEGDPVTLVTTWWLDGVEVSGTTAADGTPTLPRWAYRGGEDLSCSVTATDGVDTTEAVTSDPVRTVAFDRATVDPFEGGPWLLDPPAPLDDESFEVQYDGPLADAESIDIVYGWDGWVVNGGAGTPVWLPEGYYFVLEHRETLTRREDGVWTADLTLPAGREALHARFEASDGRVDDRDGRQYAWGFPFPFVGPFVSFYDAPSSSTSMVVSFEGSVPCRGLVEYGPGGVADRVTLGDEIETLHKITLTDLEPATEYTYRVSDCGGLSSPWYTFRTAELHPETFEYLVMADMQDFSEAERWPEIAAEAKAVVPDARFVLMPGDLAADDYPGFWWRFLHGGRALFAETPILPVVGNHDTPTIDSNPDVSSFEHWFGPASYTMTYGSSHFILISSEDTDGMVEGGATDTWVQERVLDVLDGGVPRYDWVFASMHHPPYDLGARFADETDFYQGTTRTFDGVVDWMFTGHSHIGQRFQPLQHYEVLAPTALYGLSEDDGVGYYVVPAAGGNLLARMVSAGEEGEEMRDLVAYPTVDVAAHLAPAEHGFVTAGVDHRSLTLTMYGMGSDDAPTTSYVVDSFSYTKP